MRTPFAPAARRRLYPILNVLVLASLLLAQAGLSNAPAFASERKEPASSAQSPVQQDGAPTETTTGGLTLLLSEGSEAASSVVTTTVAASEPLTPEETQALLDRLPPLVGEAADVQEFRLPEESLPPPQPQTIVEQSFPPTETVALTVETTVGDLQVLRFAPEGEIRMAPFLQVTFDQPMIALGTLEQVAAEDVPVTLTPQLPGVWKWLGTRTLTFEYKGETGDPAIDRFPMATEYTAEVPEGTTSAVGGVLQETVRWSFTTPPVTLRYGHPMVGPQPLNPLIFASFDQLIDPEAVLNTITVVADGEAVDVRLAADDEVAADTTVTQLAKQAGEGRWLALRPEQDLPYNATVNVNIGPNTPSAEGPLVTDAVQSFTFQTYGPFRAVRGSCAWGGNRCQPGSPFQIEFTNPIDQKAFDPALVTVTPEIPGLNVQAYGSTIQVFGATAGRTTYKVRIGSQLQDTFGQTLGEDSVFTFQTDRAYPTLTGPYQGLVTADPYADPPVFTVYAMNYPRLHVRLYAVEPDDWSDWQTYQRDYWQEPRPTPPGELVYEEVIQVEGESDALTAVDIDLTPGLGGQSTGHVVAIVDLPKPLFGDADSATVQAWVQVTQLALDAFSDSDQLLVWATRLADGAPVADLPVTLEGARLEGVTGADGTLTLDLNARNGTMLVAEAGDDSVILPRYVWDYYGDSGWSKHSPCEELRWYIFDDRQMYRPGEGVHIKGWVRQLGAGPEGDIGLVPLGGASVQYQVYDPVGATIDQGSLDLNDLDGFDFAFTLPEGSNLGSAYIYFQLVGEVNNLCDNSAYHNFQVQEFRRPEFEVSAQTEGEGPWYLGESAVTSVKAAYYAGGPLPNADALWTVTATPSSYSPPNWPDFTFGTWQPWWRFASPDVYFSDMYYDPFVSSGMGGPTNYEGKTDATGTHYLRMDFIKSDEPRPYTVNAEASVQDVNRQTWAASTSLLMHPSALYVGLQSKSTFVEAGQPMTVAVIVTDVDGNPVAETPASVQAARQEWIYEKGTWLQKDVDVQTCEVVSGNEPETCVFDTTDGGEYRIVAEVRDERERLNRSELTRWVSGGGGQPSRGVHMQDVELIPDKQTYEDGDVAEILVQSPFGPAEGLLTLARNGIVSTERFTIDESTATLRVPILEEYVPNIVVKVDLTGSAPRLDDKGQPAEGVPPRPAFASGQISLPVPPIHRTIALEIAPEASELEPGALTSIDVVATNSNGDPVEGAELAIVVVDEAVLALTNYQLADPLLTFYREMGSGVESVYTRQSVILIDPAALAEMMVGGRGGGGGEMAADAVTAAAIPAPAAVAPAEGAVEESAFEAPMATLTPGLAKEAEAPASTEAIAVRSNFNPLAIFAPAERTDAEGRARIEFTMPDNLTRYRVMVVAATEKDFGSAEANVTARLPLMVRPSAPRFLNFGDHFEFPVVVQNQTDEPIQVDVAMGVSNLTLDDPLGKRVTVPANDRVELRFPASPENAGTARFQVAAASADLADAANGELPVYTPATTEAFAVYGVVDEGAVAQPLSRPQNVFPQFGGLELNTSSTALSALTDAVIYLYHYPFECSEQISSRVLSITSLRDVLTAFNAAGLPSPAALNASMEADIKRLVDLQNLDGGWPIWEKGKESIPYNSIYTAQALQMARSKDYTVPQDTLDAALFYLRNIESNYPHWYSEITRRTLTAYALYVRDLMGDTDAARARAELNSLPLEDQSLEAIAWLWQVLSDDPASTAEVEAIRQHINNSAVETAGAANFYTSYGDQDWVLLHSNRRTDGIVLDAMINDEPESDLIPKVVNGLLAAQDNGRWNNTQENTFILMALDRYFNTYENVEPDFVARAWLGDTFIAEHAYQGYTTESSQTVVPMNYLLDQEAETTNITIAREGDGRLYYRLGLDYAPTDLNLDAMDMGFVVSRVYEAIDNPDDVVRDADGTWRIKAGARVRVRLQMVADSRRYHVALVDPLPAGLEAVNPALATSPSIAEDPVARPYGWWWYGTWYEHQNLRDERAEAFTSLLWDGVYDYTYVAQATTPGEYVVPPAKAEEMYSPEVFGRSASDRVVVE